jgi:formylglycine-generating enzyme required for sulfatase activity
MHSIFIPMWTVSICLLLAALATPRAVAQDVQADCQKLRAVIADLTETFPDRYPHASHYVQRLDQIERRLARGDRSAVNDLESLRRVALLANPLIAELPGLLLVKRQPKQLDDVFTERDHQIGFSAGQGREIGMPSNHECNASLERDGYDNALCRLSPVGPDGTLSIVYRPPGGGYIGDLELHFDAQRLLFTQSGPAGWKIHEMDTDGTNLRQVSQMPDDVDAMDPCYLPNGRIVFGSTSSYQSVPCWHGCQPVSNLCLMDADGSHVRQLCFDQDHNFHPAVLPSGQVLYQRWDYTGISHIYLRQLMTMNPDGTRQRAIYGSNSWYPNSLFFPQPIPGKENRLLCILSGYHGVHRMGQLVIVDPSVGWAEERGIVQRISGRGARIEPKIRDALVNGDWPMFLHPRALSEKYFLVSCQTGPNAPWGIYLADVFDNLVLVHETPGYALLEPTPLVSRPAPPALPEQVSWNQDDASVFIRDVYAGPGLADVPRGTIKRLRLVAYHFGYRGLAGSDKIGYGGPWEAMRILGTAEVEADGSASFRVPACTPISIQTLDAKGQAVQLMRSWFTAMPGEHVSCVGCHETPQDVGPIGLAHAAARSPAPLAAWYGPARGFDFEREVQPVLDRYCVSCHDGSTREAADLRSEANGGVATPRPIGYVPRLHPDFMAATGGRLKYTPAYDVLIHYIRRVGIEDDVSLLTPGEYHADTSELVQLLRKGHHGVMLDDEAWDRLVTWIDLNGPCHGTWGDVFPVPDGAHQRRMELRKRYGGPVEDPEAILEVSHRQITPVQLNTPTSPKPKRLEGWPLSAENAAELQGSLGQTRRELDLGDGNKLTLVRIPAGGFLMGDVGGQPDESPQRVVRIERPFWIGQCEVTNAQFRRFDPTHDSRYYVKRRDRADGKGLSLNGDRQPAVRVSWNQANEFCRWLSRRTGTSVTLPTEEQWEYVCRAGSGTALHYGTVEDDFSSWGNMGDLSFSTGLTKGDGPMMPDGGVTQVTGGVPHLLLEGAQLADTRFDDGHRVTAEVGSYQPNAWGLFDMHGNAAEWTRDAYGDSDRRTVRGGSFFDRPARCRSSFRLAFPSWQRVFNVGFRIVVVDEIQDSPVTGGGAGE